MTFITRHWMFANLQFRSFGQRRSFHGRCVTVRTFEDHLPVLEALQKPGNDGVLVVDAGGSLRVGVMGDRVAEVGMRNGWAGAIIHGAIRDSAGIDQLDFGVKALGATARRTWLHGTGHHAVPLAFGGTSLCSRLLGLCRRRLRIDQCERTRSVQGCALKLVCAWPT